jgi:glycosyltransferase involved in cell wall biosynthesis
MKIFINAIAALQGGGVTYLNQLLSEWSQYEDVEIDIYGFSKVDEELKHITFFNFIDVPNASKNLLYRIMHEKVLIPRLLLKNQYDIAFFPNCMVTGFVPSSTVSITMFRNMLPFSRRDIKKFKSVRAKLRYRILKLLYLKSYKKADHVIFISNYAQNVISEYIPNITTKSSVVPHGIAKQFENRKDFQKNGYLLYVSILNEYKHQIEIVKGLGIFKKNEGYAPKLLLAGFIKEDYKKRLFHAIQNNDLENEVEILGAVKYDNLPDLYKKAKLVLFGSTCENCPNILLEAMSTNSSILCSSFQPMPEFLEDAGFYFNPEEPQSFYEKLKEIWNENEKLKEKANSSFELSKQYSWEVTANKTFKIFQSLLKGKRDV